MIMERGVDEKVMERSASSSSERYVEFMEDSCCSQFCTGPNPGMARYVYGLIFLLTNLLAWAVRDYGQNFLSELKTGAKKLNGARDSWHSGWWAAKILLWLALMMLPFLIPSSFILLYGEVAHFGAGVFLLIQLISIISFITWLNHFCCSEKNADKCRVYVLATSIAAYVASMSGIVMMYIWYVPQISCMLNIFFITLTMALIQVMTCVSLHKKVNGGLLTPGLMGLYVVFICWCAIRRQYGIFPGCFSLFLVWSRCLLVNLSCEPLTEICNRKAEVAAKGDWLTYISFIIALLAMVIATFSTGIDSKSFQFRKDDVQTEDDVPYGYGFFHFVFATGSMYFGMLLIGWNTHHKMQKWTIDVGWTSAWVRIVNEWLAACVYIWMLIAPLVWKNQQTAESSTESTYNIGSTF